MEFGAMIAQQHDDLVMVPCPEPDEAEEVIAREAIAREIVVRLRPLISLCAYVGWRNISQHLTLAEGELVTLIKGEHLNCAQESPAENIA